MAKWTKLELGLVNLDAVEAAIDQVADILETLAGILELIAAALDILSILLVEFDNLLKALLDAVVLMLEEMVLDLLQTNAHLAVHLNMQWNHDWKYKKEIADPENDTHGDPSHIVDWVNDGLPPFIGTGMTGWLLDVGASSYDETDPFRPFTDELSEVAGFIFVKGAADSGELTSLKAAYDLFSDFSEKLDIMDDLEAAGEAWKSLARLGAAAFRKENLQWAKKLVDKAPDAYGTLIAEGVDGENDSDSTAFYLEGDAAGGFASVEAGDVLRLSDSAGYYEVINVDSSSQLTVDPPIAKSHLIAGAVSNGASWNIRRGGLVSLMAKLPLDKREFIPGDGNYPIWVSVPIAALVPGLKPIFEELRRIADLLKTGLGLGDSLAKLATLLREKAEQLQAVVDALREALAIISAIAAFLEESSIFSQTAEAGGMAQFMANAMTAEDMPDYGTNGVVVGVVGVTTAASPAATMEKFMGMIGVQLSEFSDTVGDLDAALEETWDDYVEEPEEVE